MKKPDLSTPQVDLKDIMDARRVTVQGPVSHKLVVNGIAVDVRKIDAVSNVYVDVQQLGGMFNREMISCAKFDIFIPGGVIAIASEKIEANSEEIEKAKLSGKSPQQQAEEANAKMLQMCEELEVIRTALVNLWATYE